MQYSLNDGVRNLLNINEILSIDFQLDPQKYIAFGSFEDNKMATLSVHHPRMLPSPNTKTYLIQPETENHLTITKTISSLLPSPYKTQCHQYSSKDKKISREDCIDECVVTLYQESCGCRPYYLSSTTILFNSSIKVCTKQVCILNIN